MPTFLVVVGKREAKINWSMVIPEEAAPVTGNTLRTTGPVPVDSQKGAIIWSMVIPAKAAPLMIGTTLRTTDPVPADSRQ